MNVQNEMKLRSNFQNMYMNRNSFQNRINGSNGISKFEHHSSSGQKKRKYGQKKTVFYFVSFFPFVSVRCSDLTNDCNLFQSTTYRHFGTTFAAFIPNILTFWSEHFFLKHSFIHFNRCMGLIFKCVNK